MLGAVVLLCLHATLCQVVSAQTGGAVGASMSGLFAAPAANDGVSSNQSSNRQNDGAVVQIQPPQTKVPGNIFSNFLSPGQWTSATQPNGTSNTQVRYFMTSTTNGTNDAPTIQTAVHHEMSTGNLSNVWTAPEGNLSFLDFIASTTSTATTPTAGTTITLSTSTSAQSVIPTIPPVATDQPQFVPVLQSDLFLANYSNNDARLISQGLRGLWAAALGTTTSNVKIQTMDSSDAPTSANGLPLSDFKYQLLTNQRIPDVVAAWNQFIQKVTDSGLKDLLKALPFSAPVSLRTTTATTTATTTTTAEQTTDEDIIIPLLTFTDTINVAVPSAEEGVALANRLKILWANASGTNPSTVGIFVTKIDSAVPHRSVHGVPVLTATYRIFLRNVSSNVAVSVRAQAAAKRALLGQFYFVEGSETVDASTTTTATTTTTTTPTPPPVCLNRSMDVRLKGVEIVALQENLTVEWASAYGLPHHNVKVLLLKSETIPGNPENRRVYYCVQVAGGNETPDIVHAFERRLLISPIKPYLILPLSEGTSTSSHTLQMVVQNATEINAVLTALRAGWATALNMAALPGTSIIVRNFSTSNFLDLKGVPVITMSYDLAVPGNIEVRPEHDAAVHRLLGRSSAGPYIYALPVIMYGPTPFSISDEIVLSVNNSRQRDGVLQLLSRVWADAIGGDVNDTQIKVDLDQPYTGPLSSNATHLRLILHTVTGTANQPVDDYAAKVAFRAIPTIDGVAFSPSLSHYNLAGASSLRSVLNSWGVPELGKGVAACPTPKAQLLWLPRTVDDNDKVDISRLIASAWAKVNYWVETDLQVDIKSLNSGIAGDEYSSVIYTITGPTCDLVPPPNRVIREMVMADLRCNNCFQSLPKPFSGELDDIVNNSAGWNGRSLQNFPKAPKSAKGRQHFFYDDIFLLNFRDSSERDHLLRQILVQFKNINSDVSLNGLSINMAKLIPTPEYGELTQSVSTIIRGQSAPALNVEDARSRLRTIIQQGRIPGVEWAASWISISDNTADTYYVAPDVLISAGVGNDSAAMTPYPIFENWQPFTYNGIVFSNETRARTLVLTLENFRRATDRRLRNLQISLGCPMADTHNTRFDITGDSDPPMDSASAGTEFSGAANHTAAGDRVEFSYSDQLIMQFDNDPDRDGLLISVLEQFREALPNYSFRNLKVVVRKQLPAPEIGINNKYAVIEIRGRSCPALDLDEARQNLRGALRQGRIPNVKWAMSWIWMDDDQSKR